MGSKLLALLLLLIPGIAYGQTPIHLLMSQSEARTGSTVDPDPNLTACWDMEETSGTRADATANGHDLLAGNAPGSRTGKVGSNAADFDDASSQYLYWADEADNNSASNDHSIALWVYFDDISANYSIASKAQTSNQREWDLWNGGSPADDVYAQAWNDQASQIGNTKILSNVLAAETWYFIVYVWDGTAMSHSASIDGSALGTFQTTSFIDQKDTSGQFNIAARDDGSSRYLDGAVDAVRWYHGYKLTDTDITNLYNSGSGQDCSYAMP